MATFIIKYAWKNCSSRLGIVLPNIISPDQMGFIKQYDYYLLSVIERFAPFTIIMNTQN